MKDFTFKFANANFITESLAIGGDLADGLERAADQAAELVDTAGISHVLDVRWEAEETLWKHFPDVEYRWDGIDDAGQRVPAAWFDRITTWAAQAIADGGVVLSHCHMGINRGPSAGFAVLLRLGWDPIDALDVIRAARPIANTAYAEDALAWHLGRIGATPAERTRARRRVADWRRTHPLDTLRIIRSVRSQGDGWAARTRPGLIGSGSKRHSLN